MVLGRGKVPRVRSSGDSGNQSGSDAGVRDVVPEHSDSVVPSGPPDSVRGGPSEAQRELHIALVVPDLRVYGELKRNAFAVAAHDVTDKVILHFILQRKDQDNSEIVQRWALTELGLVAPKVTGLQYPEEIQLGWESDESAQRRFEET